jgi:hypothetical protein
VRSDFWIGPQDGLEWDKVRSGIIDLTVLFSQFCVDVLRNDEFDQWEGMTGKEAQNSRHGSLRRCDGRPLRMLRMPVLVNGR